MAHKKMMAGKNHYSPCPKIPVPSSENGENHYTLHPMNASLVPLNHSEEKASGRRSARHNMMGSEKKKAKINGSTVDARSMMDPNQNRFEMLSADPYDRKSFDSKGQTLHRSAMHVKNTPGHLPKGSGSQSIGHDLHNLHEQKNPTG